jgi:hypothetical protein
VPGEKNAQRRDAALSALKELQSGLGGLNDIATREKLMSEMGNVFGKEAPASRVPFVAGVIYGTQQARTADLLQVAEKAHQEFSDVKAFWKI